MSFLFSVCLQLPETSHDLDQVISTINSAQKPEHSQLKVPCGEYLNYIRFRDSQNNPETLEICLKLTHCHAFEGMKVDDIISTHIHILKLKTEVVRDDLI